MSASESKDQMSRNSLLPVEALTNAVRNFEAISLEEMDGVKLMDRFDTKFVFSIQKLPAILEIASRYYRILQIGAHRQFRYSSTYFDTKGTKMFRNHHNQKLNRFKVRKRHYLDTGQVFFEIKFKTNKGQTRKKRIATSNLNGSLGKEEKKFLQKVTPYRAKKLSPMLINGFQRITLVHKGSSERVTIDMDLSYAHHDKKTDLPFLTITEIKQSRSTGVSVLQKILKEHHIYPQKFSKYCMGMVLLKPNLKYNRFKQKLLTINKIDNDSGHASFNN